MNISRLDDRRVALWGWGREGRAAWRALRKRLPALPLTVLCGEQEAAEVAALADPLLQPQCSAVDAAVLGAFEVVVKSPGISPYRDDVQAAQARGTRFVGGTGLWFAERPDAVTLCVTGTKGKSTTTAMLAHLLRSAGHRTALAGNIGLPLLDLLDVDAAYWAIELSSYQTMDVAESGVRPRLAIVTNVYPEHLDWHGSQARYVQDKLALLTAARPRIAVLNAGDATLAGLKLPDSRVHWYNHGGGWHLRGRYLHRGDMRMMDADALPFPGEHNRANLCGVLCALEALDLDARGLAGAALSFQPLPHRLQELGVKQGLRYVNDSISTTPHATLAALAHYAGQPVALLVGGHDRGVEWDSFARRVSACAPKAIITMGQNGERIRGVLAPVAADAGFALHAAGDLAEAVRLARLALGGEGVVLLSPGAPSFGAYPDYVARGRHFAKLAGFDPDALTAIRGLAVQ